MKAIKTATDKKGNKLAIATDGKTHSVWIQKENHVQGHMVKSWSFIKRNITAQEAEEIFQKRAA